MKMYFLSSHVFYPEKGFDTYGPAHGVFEFLKKYNKSVFFMKHDILGKEKSYVINNKNIVSYSAISHKNLFLRYFLEIYSTVKAVKNLSHNKEYVYIGVDPINGLAGVLLKYFFGCQKYIYFSADYSDRRYENLILNQAYFFFDRVALCFADEVWSVSSRIASLRQKQGLPNIRNKVVPNAPDFSSIKHIPYDGNLNLILVSNLQDTLALKPILDALKLLHKKYPHLHLVMIGSGPKEAALKKMVSRLQLSSSVSFVGQKNHDEVLSYIQNSFLGIAFYTPNGGNKYGDSMKVREYLACGIPVIMNDVPATADDVVKYSAGLVVHTIKTKKVAHFLQKCMEDQSYYKMLRKNALTVGKLFDKEKLLQSLLLSR